MSKIMELRSKRNTLWEQTKAFLEKRRGENGLVEASAVEQYNKMAGEVQALGAEIERLEQQAAVDAALSAPTSKPVTNAPGGQTQPKAEGTASEEYKSAFWDMIRNKGDQFAVRNALNIGEDTEGGYTVPDEFERRLIQALEENNIFRQMATVIKTSSGDRKIPIVTSKGDAVWMDEEEQYTLSDDTFGQASLSAFKLGTAIKISEELLGDSVFDLPSYIAREFARRIGAKEEEAFFIGNGTGKPTGIFNATGGAQDGATTAGVSITFDDVMELFYSLRSPYRKKAVWVLNDSTVKALRKLKDGNGNYIWQPSVSAGVPDTILNRPYKTSSYVPEIGAGKKCMAFGDFSYYWIADRSGRTFKRLNELFAMTGQVGFLAMERLDGKLILPEAIKTLKVKSGSGA